MKKLFGLLAVLFAFALPAERAQSIEDVRAAVVSQVLGGYQAAERPADNVFAKHVRGVHKQRVTAVAPGTGLNYAPVNQASGGDIALVWDGSNLLPRNEHTAIWRYKPAANTGFYAVAWHSPNTGTWDGGLYSWGTHPYPASNGAVNSDGARLNGTGSVGTVHYWEQAGLGIASDFLTTPGGSAGLLVVKDQWYVQVRKCRIIVGGGNNGLHQHVFIPDLLGNPSFVIDQWFYDTNSGSIPVSGVYPGPAGSTPAFYIGASDWTASGSTNEETVCGIVRGIQLYNAYLSDTDHALEAANITSNTPVTAAGIAAKWYMNQNPTPSDVTDKSGAGHNPTWRNANRPTLWNE